MLAMISDHIKFFSFHSNPYSILFVTSVCVLSMIIALLCGYKFCEYRDMTPALNTKIYLESATVLFISTIPAMIDALIDTSQIRKLSILSPWYIGRLLIAVACFLSAIQFKFITEYASILDITNDRSLSYICTLYSLRLLLVCSMLLILNLSNPTIFKSYEVGIMNLLSCLSTVLRFFSIGEMNIITHIGASLSVITFASIIYFYTVWIYRLTTTIKVITVNDYTSILYFITITIVAIVAYAPVIQQWMEGHFFIEDATHYTPSNLALVNYGLTILTIILNIVPGRIARYEAYIYMNNNIKTKTEYVRFISHELRTPLNSVFLGLNLSISQIPEHSDKDEDKERRDTLMEIASACSAALDILNQLLFFDKLDNGILELNKSKTRVTELIHDALKMFTVQIREKNIDMKIQNTCSNVLSKEPSGLTALLDRLSPRFSPRFKTESDYQKTVKCNHFNIYMNEMIDIDKNKMIQVIRNIVSNAIKFTPEYGQISINLKFETNRLTSQLADSWKERVSSIHEPQLSEGSSGINTSTSVSPIDVTSVVLDISNEDMCMHSSSSQGTFQSASPQSLSPMTDSHNTHISHGTNIEENDDHWNRDNTPRAFGTNVEGYLVIEVTDTGAGISEANQQKLFKQIVQFKPEILQNGGGSGLGMWISKGIVDLHGGKIAVSSEGEGRGSTFTIKLPMIRIYDESIISSSKLCDCIHIRDHISLTQLNPDTVLYSAPNGTKRTKNIQLSQLTISSNIIADQINDEVKNNSDTSDFQHDGINQSNDLSNLNTSTSMESLMSEFMKESSDINFYKQESNTKEGSNMKLSCETAETHDHGPSIKATFIDPSLLVNNMNLDSSRDILNESSSSIIVLSSISKPNTTSNSSIRISPYFNKSASFTIDDKDSHQLSDSHLSQMSNLLVTHLSYDSLQLRTADITRQDKVVLVVDDSSMNRKMLCRLLKSSGYMCIEANDGVEAVTYIRENRLCSSSVILQEDSVMQTNIPLDTVTTKLYLQHDSSYKSIKQPLSHAPVNCIIMDFMMPNMDGPTATAEIRKLGYTGPIIGATGNALQADIDYFIEKGANKVLIKPLDMTSLLSAVSEI